MIELGPGADLFRLIGGVFWLLVFGALLAALLIPKHWLGKLLAALIVLGLFAAFPGRWAWERKKENDTYRAELAKAEAIFNERCKSAGEKIYRTVEGVEGILLMRVRTHFDTADQNADDPFGYMANLEGEDYIKSFLIGKDKSGYLDSRAMTRKGYHYVEAIDSKDSKRYRYTGSHREVTRTSSVLMGGDGKSTFKAIDFVLDKVSAPGKAPRYGVGYEDITTPEERDLWIAGSSFKVIDRETGEVLGERIGYMYDRGMGTVGGGRQPWANAVQWSCPYFYSIKPSYDRGGWDRRFAEQVLKIKEE